MNGKTANPFLSLIMLFSALSIPLLASAESFPQSFEYKGVQFEKQGSGTFTWYLFKVYDGAYYEGQPVTLEDGTMATPRHLELHYHRGIPADKIRESGRVILKRNIPEALFESLRPKVEEINSAYVDVEDGDSYALTFIPGMGTMLRHNGEEVVSIEGAEFGEAYFKIWTGSDPVDEGFRDDILGR